MTADHETSRWRITDSRRVYDSPWVQVWLDDVQMPDGHRIDHHVIRFPRAGVSAVVVDDQDRTLSLWRHRFITETWGWEIPAGWGEPGEEPIDSARREVEEETGYRPIDIGPMVGYKPMAGISTMHHTTFLVTRAVPVDRPVDVNESAMVDWIPLADIPALAERGHITDGPSLTALTYYLAVHRANRPGKSHG